MIISFEHDFMRSVSLILNEVPFFSIILSRTAVISSTTYLTYMEEGKTFFFLQKSGIILRSTGINIKKLLPHVMNSDL